VSVHILPIAGSHRPVFLVNSRMGHFSAAAFAAILLPKLRMQFAEFLNANSSVRLRIFSSPTCVGLRYGPLMPSLRDCFSARQLRTLRLPVGRLAFALPILSRICLEDSSGMRLDQDYRRLAVFRSMLHPFETSRGAGILTRFPSTTTFVLALGAD
jgi:hypothetical protein